MNQSIGMLLGLTVGIEENLPRAASLQLLERLAETLQRQAFVKEWLQVEPLPLKKRCRLHPGFKHPASIDALNCCTLEDDVCDQVECNRFRGNAQKRGAPAGSQHLKPLLNCARISAHLQEDIHPGSPRQLEDAPNWVDFGWLDGVVCSHSGSQCEAVRIDLDGENCRAAAGLGHGDGHQTDGPAT